jgi:hypothetical protein
VRSVSSKRKCRDTPLSLLPWTARSGNHEQSPQ